MESINGYIVVAQNFAQVTFLNYFNLPHRHNSLQQLMITAISPLHNGHVQQQGKEVYIWSTENLYVSIT